jgi:tRNA-dihydrouridine synthase C
MKLILAPMEGLLDFTLRDILTRVGGVDRCVSEFIRITDQLLPPRVFTRIVPELGHGSRTPAGVPVRPQLLGSDPSCMAENAALLATLGPAGIDLNFGCPAKTVNQHRGGAVLLDEPELVGRIVAAVRRAVPASIPVSAKMRLGNRCDGPALDCARAIDEAGADELVVHARTGAPKAGPLRRAASWWPMTRCPLTRPTGWPAKAPACCGRATFRTPACCCRPLCGGWIASRPRRRPRQHKKWQRPRRPRRFTCTARRRRSAHACCRPC